MNSWFALNEGEHLLKVFHQTQLVLFKLVIIFLTAILLPLYFLSSYDLISKYSRLLLFWSIIVLVYSLREVALWRIQKYVLTNRRLLKISHVGIFKKKVEEAYLDRVLNVSFETTGFTSSIFGFGDVEIQVVGLIDPITFTNIRKPSAIKNLVWQLHEKTTRTVHGYESADITHLQHRIGYEKKTKP